MICLNFALLKERGRHYYGEGCSVSRSDFTDDTVMDYSCVPSLHFRWLQSEAVGMITIKLQILDNL